MKQSRRNFLSTSALAGLVPLAGLTTGCGSDGDDAPPQDSLPQYEYTGELGPEDIFKCGVASGDPLKDGIILWTHLSGASSEVEVWWEIAVDEGFRQRVQVGTFKTNADRDYTVKVDVSNLSAHTGYYYRFKALGRTSGVGRCKTAPEGGAVKLRFGVVSCASMGHGYFHVYQKLSERQDLDAIIHLGDYIYEYASLKYGDVREYDPPHEIVSLEDYRKRHAHYKKDSQLQALHARYPFIVTWDDHESADNSYKDGAANHTPGEEGTWADRKAAAIKAYMEWMPIRENGEKVFRNLAYGDLVDLIMLDTRLYGREEGPEMTPGKIDMTVERELLGKEQEAWLDTQLAASKAKWQLLGQQVMIMPWKLAHAPLSEGGGSFLNDDGWDGYHLARERLFGLLDKNKIENLVVLTGDVHTSWVGEITSDPSNLEAYDPATSKGSRGVEFVVPGVSSPGLGGGLAALAGAIVKDSPHIRYGDVAQRGYVVLTVTADEVQGDYFHMESVDDPNGTTETFSTAWAVKSRTKRLEEKTSPST